MKFKIKNKITIDALLLTDAKESGNKCPSVVKTYSSKSRSKSLESANNKNKYLKVSESTKLSMVSSCLLVLTSETAANPQGTLA